MGRCYEFGASIVDGCEHPMAVADEGGYCRCTGCGTECHGRFPACPDVVAKPGYVPVLAPAVPATEAALSPVQAAEPDAAPPTPAAAANIGLMIHQEVAELRSQLETRERAAAERHRTIEDALEQARGEAAARDGELGEAFSRLSDTFDRLTTEVSAQRAELAALEERVGAAIALLDERAPLNALWGMRRRG